MSVSQRGEGGKEGGGCSARNTQLASQRADSHTHADTNRLPASTGRPGHHWPSAKWQEKQRRRPPELSGGGEDC